MGWFSNLTGGDTRKAAREAEAAANAKLEEGRAEAEQLLTQSRDAQIGILDDAYGDAFGYTNTGYDRAEDFQNQGYERSQSELGEGIDAAIAAEEDYLARANQYTENFVDSGNKAQARYDDLTGLNGAEAQAAAIDTYVNSPATDRRQQEVQRALNAQGQSSGGRAYMAAARVAEDEFNSTLDRLSGAAERGQNVSSYVSGLTSETGGRIANYEANRGSGLAGLTQDNANALAALATGRGSDLTNLSVGQGRDVAGVTGSTDSALADLALGISQLEANNAINTGNTVGNSYNTGMNNLLALAGTAAKAVAGLPA
jgi:hypothetical protein